MLESNKFYLNEIEKIVFIGYSKVFDKLIKINDRNKLSTAIITSKAQSKLITGLKFKTFDRLDNEFKKYVTENFLINKTLFISLGSRFIFSKSIIKFLMNNLVNFHASRLPYDSGGGGYTWRILREDRIDNQLVHLVDEGIDTGPIIFYKNSLYPRSCLIPIDFENYRLDKFIKFYKEFISKIINKHKFELKTQINYIGRYNPRISSLENGYIDWDYSSYDLYNFINAFDDPYPGAMTYLNRGELGLLHLKSVHLHGGDSSNHPYMSGIVIRHDKDWIVVSTVGKHCLLIEKVINKKGINVINKIIPGDRFYTPNDKILLNRRNRVFYNSNGKVK